MTHQPKGQSQRYDLDRLLRETPREKLEAMIHGIATTLWKDGRRFDPDKEWTTEEIETVARILTPYRPARRRKVARAKP